MKVEVRFESQLRLQTGTNSIEVDAADDCTLSDLLHQVADSLEPARPHLLNEDGTLRTSLMYFVNDQPVRGRDADNKSIGDQDVVSLLPPIAGG